MFEHEKIVQAHTFAWPLLGATTRYFWQTCSVLTGKDYSFRKNMFAIPPRGVMSFPYQPTAYGKDMATLPRGSPCYTGCCLKQFLTYYIQLVVADKGTCATPSAWYIRMNDTPSPSIRELAGWAWQALPNLDSSLVNTTPSARQIRPRQINLLVHGIVCIHFFRIKI